MKKTIVTFSIGAMLSMGCYLVANAVKRNLDASANVCFVQDPPSFGILTPDPGPKPNPPKAQLESLGASILSLPDPPETEPDKPEPPQPQR